MKPLAILLVLLFSAFGCAVAGEVFGAISQDGKPLAAGVKLDLAVADTVYRAETDKYGSYRVFVNQKGKCVLTLHVGEPAPTAELVSYDKSMRYDWVLESVDGKLGLRRK